MFSVLIVEDDEKIAEIHSKMLKKFDSFDVKAIATNIDDAKEFCELLKPDLIILDIYFPGGANGIDFLKWLRGTSINSDVIVITAAREYNILQKTIKRGIFDYLIKPVTMNRLKDSLERFVKIRKSEKVGIKIEQDDVDKILLGKNINIEYENLPKGIDNFTLNKIKNFLLESKESYFTVEHISQCLGISRNTARRYLEYLVSIGFLNVDQDYGSIGRPERKYMVNANR